MMVMMLPVPRCSNGRPGGVVVGSVPIWLSESEPVWSPPAWLLLPIWLRELELPANAEEAVASAIALTVVRIILDIGRLLLTLLLTLSLTLLLTAVGLRRAFARSGHSGPCGRPMSEPPCS